MRKWLLIYVLVINVLSYFLFYMDKARARKKQTDKRIPELVLILSAFLGGSLGAVFGMRVFRHKTRKIKFLILIPLSFIANVLVIYYGIKMNIL